MAALRLLGCRGPVAPVTEPTGGPRGGPATADPAVRVSPAPASSDLGLEPVAVTPTVRERTGMSARPTVESAGSGDGKADGDVLVVVGQGSGRFRVGGGRAGEVPAARDPADPGRASDADHHVAWSGIPVGPGSRRGVRRLEVVLDGWRFEFDVEPEARAQLVDRARRDHGTVGAGGAAEVRAMIPGRVLDVAVRVGDAVEAGQRVLVIEAMKMQNELRAPRAGVVTDVRVGAGQTVELGDLLLTIADAGSASIDGTSGTAGSRGGDGEVSRPVAAGE